jgi:hypothetical protein
MEKRTYYINFIDCINTHLYFDKLKKRGKCGYGWSPGDRHILKQLETNHGVFTVSLHCITKHRLY